MKDVTNRPIILTLTNDRSSSRIVWNGRKPIGLGHPRRWTLDRVENGVRLRSTRPEAADKHFLFDTSELEKGAKLSLDGISLELHASATLPAAHEPDAGANAGRMRVYRRARGWTFDAANLGLTYTGMVDGIAAFRLTVAGSEYWLTSVSSDPVRVISKRGVHELRPTQVILLKAEELAGSTIRVGAFDWSFNRPEQTRLPAALHRPDPERAAFQKSLSAASSLVAAFVFVCFIWPRPSTVPEPEITPTQTITLAAPMKQKVAAMGSGATKKGSQEARKDSVAPAFQANKLQSAMKGLFRGGMTQLLAKSEFGPGADKSDSVRKLFNSNSGALHSTAPLTGPGIGRGTSVATLGGGDGQGSGMGVGYGSGEHANVQGQGKSLVAMDTSGSSVDEGLTKEEVGKVIHRHMAEVRYCYESSIIRTPELEGKLVLGFTINGSGRVKGAEVRGSTLSDSQLDDCIMRRLAGWKFPNTKGGIDVAVTYPFIFKTLGG